VCSFAAHQAAVARHRPQWCAAKLHTLREQRYEADRYPDMAARPVDQRFGNSPWGLYHIGVEAG
jgi:hypothetical protein